MKKIGFILLTLFFITNIFSQETEFHLTYSDKLSSGPISGRVILILNEDTLIDPDIPSPFQPTITFGTDFKNWKQGEELVLTGNNTDSYLSSIDKLSGDYSLRALVDTDSTSCLLYIDGILYSDKVNFIASKGAKNVINVTVNNILSGHGFKESKNIKLLKFQSELLSSFYGMPSYIEAALILPEAYYADTLRSFPVVYVFPGWGTTHIAPSRNDFQQKRYGMTGYGEEKIFVFLNQDSRFGFHVFADSDNNGPRAKSFITEFIPFIENNYRVAKNSNCRFLTGQSSGAWAAIWLMVNYPDKFAMVWAGSPDPVDFRDFTGHNLYSINANLFYDSLGNMTNSIRSDQIIFTNKQWLDMETVLGEGGQYQSFEAVFGRRDANNKPEQVFDRQTGAINKEALEHWKNYDINLIISKNAEELKNKLSGKINIVVSDNDDFYLDGPVRLLKQTLDNLGISADIKFLKDSGHSTWNDETRKEMHNKIDEILHKN